MRVQIHDLHPHWLNFQSRSEASCGRYPNNNAPQKIKKKNVSSPRKLLRSTFLGWILNFRSGNGGLYSTGGDKTRCNYWAKRLWKDRITGEKKEGEERHEVLQNHHNMLFKKYRSREATLPLSITSIFLNFTKNTF